MISLSLALVKLILATILATAGIAKLLTFEEKPNRQEDQRSLRGQITRIVTKPLLPLTEISLAILLLIPTSAEIAAVFVALLFGIFLTLTLYNLFQKKESSCRCFGQFSNHRVGWMTALRTASFLIAAVILAFSNQITTYSDATFATTLFGIAVLFSGTGMVLVLNEIVPKIRLASGVSTQSSQLGRRDVLKGMGAVVASAVTLGFHKNRATASSCCHCQYYDHFEPGCCDPYAEKRTKHHFRRCCNSCTGANGYWQKYQADACVYACDCYQSCDVLHGCSGGVCHCGDCGCCL